MTNARTGRKGIFMGLGALCLTFVVGCQDPGWFSDESNQGKELRQIAAENRTFAIDSPKEWPIGFKSVVIEKRFTDRQGTQYRALLPWQRTESGIDSQEVLRRIASTKYAEIGEDRVDSLTLRVEYSDGVGNPCGAETVLFYPGESAGNLVLTQLGKIGSPQRIKVSVDSVSFSWTMPTEKPEAAE
jgi:hypothetical protein